MKLSLRSKLLFILILLPTIGLVFYALRAITLVAEDKKAYVFDSAVIIAKALATQTRIELDFYDTLTDPIFKAVDLTAYKFGKESYDAFRTQTRIEHMFLFRKVPSGAYVLSDQMYLPTRAMKTFAPGGELVEMLISAADQSGFAIRDLTDAKRYFLIANKLGSPNNPAAPIVLSLYSAPDLYEAFAAPSAYRSYLVTRFKFLSLEPKFIRRQKWRDQITSVNFFNPIFYNRFPVGTAEITGANGDSMLVSFAEVGRSGLLVASVVERAVALGAVQKLIIESVLVLLGLLGITILVSVFASTRLTSALQQLVQATRDIAEGRYDVKFGFRSNDEVGLLADSISKMSGEILRSIENTAEIARLSNELQTVKLVQDMMFPPADGKIGPVEIAGQYIPAAECGGDWYSYSMMGGDRLFIWAGDVTGHGASAALITASAKAVSAVIEAMPDIAPAMALKLMNHAIYSTAKGQVMMTFAILAIDLKTGLITYANASHEPAFVLPAKEELKKRDFVPLCDVCGPRLGEGAEADYLEATHQLNAGDLIFLYTDGLVNLNGPAGQELGERGTIKLIADCLAGSGSVREKLNRMVTRIEEHRSGVPSKDDLTLLAAQFNP